MSFDIACKIIDYEFEHAYGFDEIEFDLFGGEPFIEFDLVKQIIEYISYHPSTLPRIVFATTNGTLLTPEIKDFLTSHTDIFQCGISYDGTPAMQNINRSNSADDIDLDFFAKTYPNQGLKMTISTLSLPTLCDGVIFLHNTGFKEINCNLAYNIDWSDEKNKKVLERELFKLIEFYLDNPQIEPCSILGSPISPVAYETKFRRWCGAGVEMATYDVFGNRYPCQFFMPLSCGEEKAKQAKELIFYDKEIPVECIEEKCKQCKIHAICPTCFGANYVSTGNIYVHDDSLCALTKITALARSYFRAKQWEAGQNIGDFPDATLKSIEIIQQYLSD